MSRGPHAVVLIPHISKPDRSGTSETTVKHDNGTSMEDACLPAVLPAGVALADVVDNRSQPGDGGPSASARKPEHRPRAELADLERFVGGASWAVLSLGRTTHLRDGKGRLLRLAARVANATLVRWDVRRARRRLTRDGYAYVETLYWDGKHALALPDVSPRGRPLRERLPQRAFVIGKPASRDRTVLDDVVAEAGAHVSEELGPIVPLVKSGQLVVLSERHVLRVALGPGARRIERHFANLSALAALPFPERSRGLLPRPVARGQVGDADWSLEERLPGEPVRTWTSTLMTDALEFLVSLHGHGRGADPRLPSHHAATVERFCAPRDRPSLTSVAEWADARLADVPAGWAHGDFYRGNLLRIGDRLSGVIDWDSGGSQGLPLLDLIHLTLEARGITRSSDWGPRLVEVLVPWARAGGDDATRRYCDRVGVVVTPETLLAFVIAYWLDRLRYQLEGYADRSLRPVWMERNLKQVLREFDSLLGVPPGTP